MGEHQPCAIQGWMGNDAKVMMTPSNGRNSLTRSRRRSLLAKGILQYPYRRAIARSPRIAPLPSILTWLTSDRQTGLPASINRSTKSLS